MGLLGPSLYHVNHNMSELPTIVWMQMFQFSTCLGKSHMHEIFEMQQMYHFSLEEFLIKKYLV